MSKLFNDLKKQTETLTELQKKAYQAGYDAGYKAKKKELLEEAEKNQALLERDEEIIAENFPF